ncbi:MAG: LppX_LprAFG lipoprotein, partial [Actinobacteria bacterium]|nr:LppX_LprAFG lipoprotein [Actinomycetota bacterium]
AAEGMATVTSVQFRLEVEGEVGILGVRRAEGLVTRQGEGSGSIFLEVAGRLVEYQIRIADGTYYLKGPTGGFQALPPEAAAQLYDPSVFLDPDEGIAPLVAEAREATTAALEEVSGRGAYRVDATVGVDLLGGFVPLDEGTESMPASLWIEPDGARLLRIRVEVPVAGQSRPTVMEVTLSAFDVPADVLPPT